FSPNGKLLAAPVPGSGTPSAALTLFDAATGKAIRKIESPQPIASFAFSPDSRTLATENANRTITIWEVASGTERRRLGKPSVAQPGPSAEMMGLAIAIDGIGVDSRDP